MKANICALSTHTAEATRTLLEKNKASLEASQKRENALAKTANGIQEELTKTQNDLLKARASVTKTKEDLKKARESLNKAVSSANNSAKGLSTVSPEKAQADQRTIEKLEAQVKTLKDDLKFQERLVEALKKANPQYKDCCNAFEVSQETLNTKIGGNKGGSLNYKQMWNTQKGNIADLRSDKRNLKKTVSEKEEEVKNLTSERDHLKKELQRTKNALKHTGPKATYAFSDDVLTPAKEYVTNVLKHQIPMIDGKNKGSIEKRILIPVYLAIKDKRHFEDEGTRDYLPQKDFCELYRAKVVKFMCEKRSNRIEKAKEAAEGKFALYIP